MPHDHGYEVDPTGQCTATTAGGKRCKNRPLLNDEVCFIHLPGSAKVDRNQGLRAMALNNLSERGNDIY